MTHDQHQAIFDFVLAAIRQQGRASIDPTLLNNPGRDAQAFCRYRGPDGVKCAFGHVIPDELYDPKTENASASSVIAGHFGSEQTAEKLRAHIEAQFGTCGHEARRTFDALQAVHDGAAVYIDYDQPDGHKNVMREPGEFMTEYVKNMRDYAFKNNLSFPDA